MSTANADKWNQSTWEDLISRLLVETIKNANDDEWTTNLGEQLAKQIESYTDPDVKVEVCLRISVRIASWF